MLIAMRDMQEKLIENFSSLCEQAIIEFIFEKTGRNLNGEDIKGTISCESKLYLMFIFKQDDSFYQFDEEFEWNIFDSDNSLQKNIEILKKDFENKCKLIDFNIHEIYKSEKDFHYGYN